MAYQATTTAGTVLKVTIAAVPTVIDGIISYDGPGGDKEEVDLTPLNSNAKVKGTGAMDWGQVDVEMFYDSTVASHTYIRDQAKTPNTTDTLTLELSDSGAEVMTCTGSFKGFRYSGQKAAGNIVRWSFVLNAAPSFA